MRQNIMPRSHHHLEALAAFALLAFPLVANANAVIPYLWVPVAQVFLFPIIVLVEGWLVSRWLSSPFWRTTGKSFVANLASTAVGALLYFTSMPLVGEPLWNFWRQYKTPAAALLSLAVAGILFLASWAVEGEILVRWFKNLERKLIMKAVGRANALTYAVLCVFSFMSI